MRHTPGEQSHTFHALRLPKLCLERVAFRDITDDRLQLPLDDTGRHLDFHEMTVLVTKSPLLEQRLSCEHLRDSLLVARHLVGVPQGGNVERQRLFARIAEHFAESGIDGGETPVWKRVDDNPVGCLLEQTAVAPFARPKRFFGVLHLRKIMGDADHAECSVGATNGAERQQNGNLFAVSATHAHPAGPRKSGTDVLQHGVDVAPSECGGRHLENVSTHRFCRGPAVSLLCCAVAVADDIVGVAEDDRLPHGVEKRGDWRTGVGVHTTSKFTGQAPGVAFLSRSEASTLSVVRTFDVLVLLACLGSACACASEQSQQLFGDESAAGVAPDAGTSPDVSHTFPDLDIPAGGELTGVCQSWTLGNDSPIEVNRIVATNPGGVHHSNWIWVPDNLYPGADGTWQCADRNFDQVAAGAFGGVFFAQSTQALTDTQAFAAGVAFEMPAHARIIGDVHLLNTTAEDMRTAVHFDIFTLPSQEVRVPLQPMAFTNLALDIPPQMQTDAHMQCAVPQPDFDVYYVLPHYHELGTAMRIDVAGGSMDGASIFSASPAVGEPWGHSYDPPFSVRGATGLGITCSYDNGGSVAVGYGNGDQEMCVALLYTSGRKAGGLASVNLTVTDVAGVHETDGLCLSVGQ